MSIRGRIEMHLGKFQRLGVWGGGGLGRTAMRYWLPASKIVLAVDANPNATGRPLGNCTLITPDAANFSQVDAVVICTSAYQEATFALRALGYLGPVFYIYELFLPEHSEQLSQLDALAIDVAVTMNDSWPRVILLKPQILVNVTFRIANWANERRVTLPVYWLCFILHHLVCLLTSIQLPLKTQIGPGLLFAHYGTIVFTQRARIGAFFTIYHGCTVGTNDSGEGPVIGDYVQQYAGSHVLGQCNIGSKSRIGANAVVLDMKCPEGSTLVGIPARTLGRQSKS